MIVIDQMKKTYTSFLYSAIAENGGGGENTSGPIDESQLTKDQIQTLTGEDIKRTKWYSSLKGKEKTQVNDYITKGDISKLKSYLSSINEVAKIGDVQKNETKFDFYKNKFNEDTQILEKIEAIENTSKEILVDVEYNSKKNSPLKMMLNFLLKDNEPNDPEHIDMEEKLDMRIRTLESKKKKLAILDIQLQTLETQGQLVKREDLIYGKGNAFENLSHLDGEARDIIGNKDFDTLTSSDFYALKKSGYDLSKILVVKENKESNYGLVSKELMKDGDKMVVNFGKNKALDRIIGAGDILDITAIKQVKINGELGERKARPRPGFYTEKGEYLDIHDAYKIEIVKKEALEGESAKDFYDAIEERYIDVRGEDIIAKITTQLQNKQGLDATGHALELSIKAKSDIELVKNYIDNKTPDYIKKSLHIETTDGKTILKVDEPYTFHQFVESISGYKETALKLTNYIAENKLGNKSEIMFDTSVLGGEKVSKEFVEDALKAFAVDKTGYTIELNGSDIILKTTQAGKTLDSVLSTYVYKGEKMGHLRYIDSVNKASLETGVPSGVIVSLIYKENETWNPRLKAPGSSAYGLGQAIDAIWNKYGTGLDRNNPDHQILVTAKLLAAIKERKNCSWEHCKAYYNTGEGIRNVGYATVRNFHSLNPAIARCMPGREVTPENYFTAAVAYYNDISFEQAKTLA